MTLSQATVDALAAHLDRTAQATQQRQRKIEMLRADLDAQERMQARHHKMLGEALADLVAQKGVVSTNSCVVKADQPIADFVADLYERYGFGVVRVVTRAARAARAEEMALKIKAAAEHLSGLEGVGAGPMHDDVVQGDIHLAAPEGGAEPVLCPGCITRDLDARLRALDAHASSHVLIERSGDLEHRYSGPSLDAVMAMRERHNEALRAERCGIQADD